MKTLIIKDINNDAYVYSGSAVEKVAFKHVKCIELPKNNRSNILPNYMKTQEYMYAFFKAKEELDKRKDKVGIFLSDGTIWYTDFSDNTDLYCLDNDVVEVEHCFYIDTFLK